ncbi:MAG: GDSL family lipase [Gammaproteobacteria bacterium]|nr:GDSL family lipase [Gammaproteobacteria bacterium]|tara:strand:- start:2863 stop:4170 length:1308 start_codon:yes stop_codon:yes gene_type:complete
MKLSPALSRKASRHPCRLSAWLLTLIMVAGAGLTAASAQDASQQQAPHWVTAWAMSPSTLPPGMLPADAAGHNEFDDQTLRLIAHVTAGGETVRIRLSNTHGNKPLHIGAASIAEQGRGSAIAAGTLQSLSFGGQPDIIIPRGAVVFSDPLPFPVDAFTSLSISLYLPEPSGLPTTHRAAMQTSYVGAAGDATRAASLDDAQAIAFWHYLTAIDVSGGDAVSTIVTVGDSITDGVGSTVDTNNRWPNLLALRLRNEAGMPTYAVANAGLSGNRVLHERSPMFGENLLARFERDVLALSHVSHLVLLEGINDMGMSVSMATDQQVSAAQIIAGYRQVAERARAHGIKVIGATLTPFEGAGYFSEAGEAKRQLVNAWIRDSGFFDAVIDFDAAIADPDNPARLPAAYTSDNLHPNDAGYAAMANSIDLSIFAQESLF